MLAPWRGAFVHEVERNLPRVGFLPGVPGARYPGTRVHVYPVPGYPGIPDRNSYHKPAKTG
eukprot:295530-Rhodomonas_salina.1